MFLPEGLQHKNKDPVAQFLHFFLNVKEEGRTIKHIMCRPGGENLFPPPPPLPLPAHVLTRMIVSGGLVYKPPVRPQQPQPIKQKQHACPLLSADVAVTIKDFCASVNLTQKFKNAEDVPIEAVYQVPKPPLLSLPVCAARLPFIQRLPREQTLTSPFALSLSFTVSFGREILYL